MALTSRTVGVEEELMLFGAACERPTPAGDTLAEDPLTSVEHELKLEQAEIASAPHRDLAELLADLVGRRAELIASAAARGVRVAALGTSPLAIRPTPTPDERYGRMQRHFGLVAEDQLTCGAHVHVSVSSRAEGVAALDGIRPWLPVLLAASANSPFWDGADTGYASYRSISWGRWPTAGPAPAFGTEDAYDRTVSELIAAGAALDRGMIYFDARLSARYPTVEIRVSDVVQHVGDSVALAALCRALVESVLATAPDPVPLTLLRAAAWRAARFGLSGDLWDPVDGGLRPASDVVQHLLDFVRDRLRADGDLAVVDEAVGRWHAEGSGADLQRADFTAHHRARDVIDGAVARTETG